jgi:hypothetical protein
LGEQEKQKDSPSAADGGNPGIVADGGHFASRGREVLRNAGLPRGRLPRGGGKFLIVAIPPARDVAGQDNGDRNYEGGGVKRAGRCKLSS